MNLVLKQNLISEGRTILAGSPITVADEFGQNLVARGIAIDAELAGAIAKLEAEAKARMDAAMAKAAEAEAAKHAAAGKIEAEARRQAEESRARADAPRRGARVAVG